MISACESQLVTKLGWCIYIKPQVTRKCECRGSGGVVKKKVLKYVKNEDVWL